MSLKNRSFLKLLDYTPAEIEQLLDLAADLTNIDAEKRRRMQAQRAAAFHRAFTSANLCEYYVNLEKNTFDTFKGTSYRHWRG